MRSRWKPWAIHSRFRGASTNGSKLIVPKSMATRWKRATPVPAGAGAGAGVAEGGGAITVGPITLHRYRRDTRLRCARTTNLCDPSARRRSVSRRLHLRHARRSNRHLVRPRATHLKRAVLEWLTLAGCATRLIAGRASPAAGSARPTATTARAVATVAITRAQIARWAANYTGTPTQ